MADPGEVQIEIELERRKFFHAMEDFYLIL